MIRLVYNPTLKRKIRQDDLPDLGLPTPAAIAKALEEGARAQALELCAYHAEEIRLLHVNSFIPWMKVMVEYLFERDGVSHLNAMMRVPNDDLFTFHLEMIARRSAAACEAIGLNLDEIALTQVGVVRELGKLLNDLAARWAQDLLTVASRRWGEPEVERIQWACYERIWRPRSATFMALSPYEQLCLNAEAMRAHFGGPTRHGEFTVLEEEDRYAMKFDPCGSGGVIRRGDAETGAPPMETDGLTTAPADWNWNKTGVHYYCTHCTVFMEKFPAVDWGAPVRPLDHVMDHGQPCTWFVYKDLARIRPEHFGRIGLPYSGNMPGK